MVNIIVHSSCLNKPISGIGRYTSNLLDVMARQDRSVKFYLDQKPGPHYEYLFDQPNIQCVTRINIGLLDVYWGPSHKLPFFRHRGLKKVLTVHDVVAIKWPQTMSFKGYLSSRVHFARSIKMASDLACVSTATANDLVECFPHLTDKINIVHPFSLPVKVTPKKIYNFRYVIFVGTFEPRKNIGRLIAAFSIFKRMQSSPLKLVLAGGPGWGGVDVYSLIDLYGLRGEVFVEEYPDDILLDSLYEFCEFLIYPSLYEGFGIPILESLRHGKPVITSESSAMPEAAGDAGYYVNPHSIDDIAKAISTVFNNQKLRKRLSSNACNQVKKYNHIKIANTMINVLKKV